MIAVSQRYTRQMLFVIMPVLPVVIAHTYIGIQSDDCRNAAALADGSGRALQMREFFDAFDWQEGTLETSEPGVALRYSVVRSYDPKKLYHHPETALFRDAGAVARSVDWVGADDGKVPIHRAYYAGGEGTRFVAYLLIYQSRPVADPYLAHLRSFPAQIIKGRLPMTLFFVSGTGPLSARPRIEKGGFDWLIHCWRNYRNACVS